MGRTLKAEHGIVCRLPGQEFGYFGWPSVARTDDGTLVAASSGLRTEHVCPFGKTVLNFSDDDGRTWSEPQVINDTPLDDRDAGIVALTGKRLLLTWFTSDTRKYFEWAERSLAPEALARWQEPLSTWTDELVARHLGSWIRLSDDGRSWGEPIRAPVSTPHGPITLAGGELLYLGKAGFGAGDQEHGEIMACRSADGGRTWRSLGCVPTHDGTRPANYHEPHVVALDGGRLVGMIRFEGRGDDDPAAEHSFHLFQTTSDDGGATWTAARPTGVYGSPPHLLRHSSGAIVCVYGCRREPYGQRAMISRDGGQTWDADWIIRNDGPDWDLGYPASAEMPDGAIFTVYYQKYRAGEKPSLLWSRWAMP